MALKAALFFKLRLQIEYATEKFVVIIGFLLILFCSTTPLLTKVQLLQYNIPVK